MPTATPAPTQQQINAAVTQQPSLRYDPAQIKAYQAAGGTLSNNAIPAPAQTSPVSSITTSQGINTLNSAKSKVDSLTAKIQPTTPTTPTETGTPTTPTPSDTGYRIKFINSETGQTYDIANPDQNTINQYLGNGLSVMEADNVPATVNLTGSNQPVNPDIVSAKNAVTKAQSDKTSTEANLTNFSTIVANDPNLKSMLDGITAQWQKRIDALNSAYQAKEAAVKTAGIRMGSRWTGGTGVGSAMGSIISAQEEGAARAINDATAQMQSALAQAQLAFEDRAWGRYKDAADLADRSYQEAVSQLNTLQKAATDKEQSDRTYDLSVKQYNETVVKDKAQLEQSKYDFEPITDAMGNRIGTQVIDKSTGKPVDAVYSGSGTSNPSSGTLGVVGTDPISGTVDKSSQTAYLQTLPKQYQALVQGIAEGRIEPPSARTKSGAQILSWVAGYDPTLSDGTGGFDATKYQARVTFQKSLANYTAGSYGAGVLSANKVIAHLNAWSNDVSNLGNLGPSSSINKVTKNVESWLIPGLQTTMGEANTEALGLKDEFAKFFKGTGTSDLTSIEEWGKGLDIGANPWKLKGIVQGALTLFSGQLNTIFQQYQSVMGSSLTPGGADYNRIIQPQTQATLSSLKNQGYEIDIPGIYFTDKNAYLSHGGSPDSLTQAYNVLSSSNDPNNPATPENVLQLAQILNP